MLTPQGTICSNDCHRAYRVSRILPFSQAKDMIKNYWMSDLSGLWLWWLRCWSIIMLGLALNGIVWGWGWGWTITPLQGTRVGFQNHGATNMLGFWIILIDCDLHKMVKPSSWVSSSLSLIRLTLVLVSANHQFVLFSARLLNEHLPTKIGEYDWFFSL